MTVRIEKEGRVWTVVHDRRSALRSHGLTVREALVKDGVAGAARFKDGLGRHGNFEKIDYYQGALIMSPYQRSLV